MSELQQEKLRHLPQQTSDSIPSFLLKTYEILQTNAYSDIISWTKNGQGFIVKKTKEFSENVLPIYFRHSNYTSFVRQLNMYDFHKTRQENHQNAFKNMMFKKGHRYLLKDIQRKDYKKNKEHTRQFDKMIDKPKEHKHERGISSQKKTDNSAFQRLLSMNQEVQRKAVALAEIKKIPNDQTTLLELIDLLFQSKKLQKALFMSTQGSIKESTTQNQLTIKKESKRELASTESKATSLDNVKESLPTCQTLFPTLQT